jgi:hypothetical protein
MVLSLMNNELEGTLKEVVVAYFQVSTAAGRYSDQAHPTYPDDTLL